MQLHHTTKTYILPLLIGTALSLAAFGSILAFVDPFTAGAVPHIFFYLTLFLTVSGVTTLLAIAIRKKFVPGILVDQLATSMRQGILVGIMFTGMLILQSQNLLYWWVGLTLILFIITVEVFFNA